jgi:EAL domain-containing protein (putative c-di-GMP-specific phosphodiesterase class I)
MDGSTSNLTTPGVGWRAPIVRRKPRRSAFLQSRELALQACSPAGLHPRPWLARLRRALAEDLFVLHFQPIVSLRDGGVSHHEALLRLADGLDDDLIAPARFLPAAERYGLIRAIDRMVIARVTALLASAGEGSHIAVNISAVSVTDPAMLGYVRERIVGCGLHAGQLVLEVTETAAISDMAAAKGFCESALELGCEVALDDFGAGFGSFQYLKHLPFTYLKIDGDFIRRLPASRTDQLVVEALARVVRGMGRETIAEFVGDESTIGMLRLFGVDYAQGFALGRPGPRLAAAVTAQPAA